MKTVAKALSGTVAAIGLGVVCSTATAAPVLCIGNVSTLNQWAALGGTGCLEGDKLYTYLGGTLINDTTPGGAPATNQLVSFAGGNQPNDIHQIFIGGPVIYASGDANATWSLDYSIQVTDPLRFLASVDLDVTQSRGSGSDTVTKQVFDNSALLLTTLTSLNGVSVNAFDFAPNTVQFVQIHETFVKTGNSIVNSAQNTYTQNVVPIQTPEPATLALLGLGLAGLAGWQRRKQDR